jgi:transglutaminase-like putative cysteine protease
MTPRLQLTGRGGFDVAAYYRITWQLLVLLVAALSVASNVVRPYIGIPLFLVSFFLVTPYGGFLGRGARVRRKVSAGIVVALALLSVHQILRISRIDELPEVMIELVAGFLPLMLINLERPRSYWLGLLSIVVVAIGSISFTSSIFIYLGFMAFVMVLVLNMNAANLYLADASGPAPRQDLEPSYFRQFLYVMPPGVLSAVLIFLAFPRVQSFTMSVGGMMGKSKTGYSGLISLEGGGEIEVSSALAFMVESPQSDFLRRAGAAMLFRGEALDHFDGVRWSSTVFDFKRRDQTGDLRLSRRHAQQIDEMTFHMEPTPTTALFYPEILMTLTPPTANVGNLLFNSNGSIVRDTYSLTRFTYQVRSSRAASVGDLPTVPLARYRELIEAESSATKEQDRSSPNRLSAKDVKLYTELPASIADAGWFKTWMQSVPVDVERDSIAAASKAIKQFFASKYEWSLKNEFSGDTLESFLTRERRGHCEYFATATTLALRSLGVPARVVVGYRGGTYNDLIEMLEVREGNAHAWSEVYVPDVGWQALDSTPASAAVATLGSGFTETARLYVNAISFLFRQYVIDYDQSSQRELIRSIRDMGGRTRGNGSAWTEAFGGYAKAAAMLVTAVLVSFGLSRLSRRGGRRDELPAYYRRFLAKMARAGLTREVGETYAAFHERLKQRGVDRMAIDTVGGAIELDLYGPTQLTGEERSQLARIVDAIEVAKPQAVRATA